MQDLERVVEHVLAEVRERRVRRGAPDLAPASLREDVEEVLYGLSAPADVHEEIRRAVFARVEDLGPATPFLEDPEVSEVILTGDAPVQVERGGVLEATDVVLTEEEVRRIGERVAIRYNRRWDSGENQTVLVRLADGSRVRLVSPPMGRRTYVNIRRYLAFARTVEELVRLREMPESWAEWVGRVVRSGFNVVVTGFTGAGKTTLLDAMVGAWVPPDRRVLVVEEVRELHTAEMHPNVAQLEASVLPGLGREEAMRRCLATALTMRPDVIVVGEVVEAEALEMVQAMLSGHPTYTTLHARDASRAMLSRLTYMLRLAQPGIPHDVLYEQVRSAVDVVLQVARLPDGRRRLTEVAEVVPPWAGNEPVRVLGRYDPARDTWNGIADLLPFRMERLERG